MKHWTQEEDKLLKEMVAYYTFDEIGANMDRSGESVRRRWSRVKNTNIIRAPIAYTAPDRTFLNAAVFDIECTSLDAVGYSGHLLATCFLPLDTDEIETVQITFEDGGDDYNLLVQTINSMAKYDILIGHNIAAFDFNWVYSRAMFYGIRMPKTWLYYDTYQVARTMAIKSNGKSLGALGAYFGLQGEKTSVYKPLWSDTQSNKKAEFTDALAKIIYHCQQDVTLNRNLFDVLWRYDKNKRLPTTKW